MKMTIAKKMWFGFSVVLILLLAISVLSYVTVTNNSSKYQFLLDDRAVKVNLVNEIEIAQKDVGRSLLDYLLFNTDDSKKNVQKNADLVISLNEELRGKLFSVETLAMMDDLDKKNKVFLTKTEEVIAAKQKNDTATVNKLTAEAKMLNASIIDTLIEIEQFLQNDMDKTRTELASSEAGAKLLIIILSVSSVLIGITSSVLHQ